MDGSGLRVSDDVLAKLRHVSSATVSHELLRLGLRETFMRGVRPLKPGYRALGPALTLRYLPYREDVGDRLQQPQFREENNQRRAIEAIEPGQVFVVDARGRTDAGVLGDVLTARLRFRGCVGVVTDGAVRDTAAIRDMSFPVFCGGSSGPVSNLIHWASDYNQPVQCGGVLVLPGDLILADDDGVVVIPTGVAAEVAERAVEHERMDAFSRSQVEAGMPIARAYPLDEGLLAEFRRRQPG